MNIKNKQKRAFISNKELLSNFRNRSMCALDRNPTLEARNSKNTNIGLIPHTKYHHFQESTMKNSRYKGDTERIPLNDMKKRVNSVGSLKIQLESKKPYFNTPQSESPKDSQNLYTKEQIMRIITEISYLLNNQTILSIFQQKLKECPSNNKQRVFWADKETKKTSSNELQLIKKIQKLYIQKSTLKKQNKNMQRQIKQLSSKLCKQLSKQPKYNENNPQLINQPSRHPSNSALCLQQNKLQEMMIKQSQIITLQNKQYFEANENLRRILYVQAKGVEKQLRKFR